MLSGGNAKTRMTEFLRKDRPEASLLDETKIWKARFEDLTLPLEFKASVQAELRFHNLDHSLIWKLQSDELIARHLTPQTKASIRIVLGTLSHFAGITPRQP